MRFDPRPVALVPPRPNLGPEPLPGPWPWASVGGAVGIAIVVGLWAWLSLRRRKPIEREADTEARPPTLLSRAADLRATLAERFGPGWIARTTEEVLGDEMLAERLGPERHARLEDLLRAADRAKFAGHGDTPAPEVEELIRAIRSKVETRAAGRG